jgi:hypothetical protein
VIALAAAHRRVICHHRTAWRPFDDGRDHAQPIARGGQSARCRNAEENPSRLAAACQLIPERFDKLIREQRKSGHDP